MEREDNRCDAQVHHVRFRSGWPGEELQVLEVHGFLVLLEDVVHELVEGPYSGLVGFISGSSDLLCAVVYRFFAYFSP